ncbi:MAG: hypothetical protein ACE5GT_06830 [Rhodospirillales bacterium]
MAINLLRNEENPRNALPRRRAPTGIGRAPATSTGGLRRHVSVFGAGAISPPIGSGASDSGLAATDGDRDESSRGSLYPLRLAARVFAFLGIGALFYALVLIAIFLQSRILEV